jgi:hypothetical protein
MQCACAIFSYAASPAVLYFSTLFHNGTIFKKTLMNVECVYWYSLQLLSETFLLQEELREIFLKMCIGLHVKYPVFLIGLLWNLNFHNRFSKNTQISNLMQIRPVGAELFHSDRRTDMKKLIAAFPNFTNASKNVPLEYHPFKCSSGTRDGKDSCGNLNL